MGLNRKIRYYFSKDFFLLIIFIINFLTNFKCKNDFDFNSKDYNYSVYFSDIDPLSSLDFEKEMDRPHKIDMTILKIEKNDHLKENFDNKFNYFNIQKKSKTFLNLKLAKNFYDVNLCIDEIDAPNKNQIFKDLNNLKSNKKNIKLIDFSHKDFINVLRKNDFTEIDPVAYNDGKKAFRYNKNENIQEHENDDDNINPIEREFEKCFKKFEFLNEDSPRYNLQKSESFNLIKIFNQTNLIQNDQVTKNILDDYIDVRLEKLLMSVKNYINQLIKWDDQNIIIELNFLFDNYNLNEFFGETEETNDSKIYNKFKIEKIFVYFKEMPKINISPETINLINSENNFASDENLIHKNKINEKDQYISLIQTHKYFENIFIDYKLLNKQVKYSKNYLDTKKPKLSTKSLDTYKNKTNSLIKFFSTLQRESIFHNRLKIEIDLDIYKKEIINSNNNNKICIMVYQHLTEDTYVEKNEIKSHLKNIFPNKEIYYFFSNEIDQEVSSDISKQYFSSFAICTNVENFTNKYLKNNPQNTKELKSNHLLEISFPIHFRYQPPVYSSFYQEVFLNLPLIDIKIQEDQKFLFEKNLMNSKFFNENIDIRKSLSYKNNRKQILNSRKLFQQEINYRLKYVNGINKMFNNLSKIRHFIPAGSMEHQYYVMIITFIVTLIGFFIIIFGIINNRIKEKIY